MGVQGALRRSILIRGVLVASQSQALFMNQSSKYLAVRCHGVYVMSSYYAGDLFRSFIPLTDCDLAPHDCEPTVLRGPLRSCWYCC